ncbi:hypothetical protein [Rhodoblastus sp.]|uniref:hypothetical protein n=1 Tax=Rhodoblastus sp. TaxID=1962975 RepID=UPI003F99A81A
MKKTRKNKKLEPRSDSVKNHKAGAGIRLKAAIEGSEIETLPPPYLERSHGIISRRALDCQVSIEAK